MYTLKKLKDDLRSRGTKERAEVSKRFFKTEIGEYGEGDIFIGVTVPETRSIAMKYKDLPFSDIKKLLASPIHEERLVAILILIHNFSHGDEGKKKEIYEYYLLHTKYVNNWDLVDLSSDKIVGEYLVDKPKNILTKLSNSKNIWERRIAIISTCAFIKRGFYKDTFRIAELLINDKHDLIHKAVGWMLREVGKRCSQKEEEKFLKKHYKSMPRTMLRYAIERFDKVKQQDYLKGKV